MEKWMQSMFHFGNLLKSDPPPISPNLDEFDLLQFLKPACDSAEPSENFSVLLNVSLLEPDEVSVEVTGGKILDVRAAHGRRVNTDGIWITRDFKYTFEIPEAARGKPLRAEWSEDEYLLIQAVSGEAEGTGDRDVVRLVPEKVPHVVRPAVELSVVRDIVQDLRDKAANALRYITTHLRVDSRHDKVAGVKRASLPEDKEEELQASGGKMEKMDYENPPCKDESGKDQKDNPPVQFYLANVP